MLGNPSLPSRNASICRYSACQKIFDVTPHHHITLVLSSLTSLHRASHPSITLHSPHYSSFCLLDTSFVASNMTVISVWETKKEKKKLGRALAMMERVVSICSVVWGDGDTGEFCISSTMIMTTPLLTQLLAIACCYLHRPA